MFGRSRLALTAALVLGMGSAGAIPAAAVPTVQTAPRKAKRNLFSGYTIPAMSRYGTKGAGISMAQQQRASKKRRNVQRHRASLRG